MAGPDDTTDELSPPPETRHGAPVIPLPLTRSIREEFLVHRLIIEKELKDSLARIENAAKAPRKDPSPDSVARKVAAGAGLLGRYTGIVSAGLVVLQLLAKAFRPDLSGPLGELGKLVGIE